MIDIFKITSIRVLKTKIHMFLLIIQLNKLQTKIKIKLRDMNSVKQICITCNKMTFHLQNHCEKTVKIRFTSNMKKMT